jgi:hypothetical protein
LFKDDQEYEYVKSSVNGKIWFEHISQNTKDGHLVKMYDKYNHKHIYEVKTSIAQSSDDDIIAVFTDITKLFEDNQNLKKNAWYFK